MSLSSLQREFVVSQPTKPTSPFEGQIWIDTSAGNTTKQYKNGVFKTISPDLSPVFDAISEVMESSAEARHKAGLSQVNADGGFFDAFVNQNKISNLTDTEVSDNSLKVGDNLLEDFEDGNISLPSPWGSFSDSASGIESNNPISGNKSYVLTANDTNPQDSVSRSTEIQPDGFSFELRLSNLKFNLVRVVISGDNDRLFRFEFSPNFSDATVNGLSVIDPFQASTSYKISFRSIDYVNETAEVFVDGVKKGDVSFVDGGSGIDQIEVRNDAEPFSSTGGFRQLFIDNILLDSNRFSTSGSATQEKFTFTDSQRNSFSPSKVGIFTESNLNGQSITYDLLDSTGTVVKTFNQADLNQLKSVSTTDTTFQVEANLSSDGTATPEIDFLDVRGSK